MILNLSSNHYLAHDAELEQRVRTRLQQAGIPAADYPYLVVKPYPEPDHMRLWLQEQHGEHCTTHMCWKGWVIFQHEADAVAFMLTYPSQNKT